MSFAPVLTAHDAGWCADFSLPVPQTVTHISAYPSCRLVTILAKPFKLSNCCESQQSIISSGRYCNFAPCILNHHFQKQLQTVDNSLSPHGTYWWGLSLTRRARKWAVTIFYMKQGNIYGRNTVTILNLATWHVGFSQSHVFTSSLQGCSTAYLACGYGRFEGTCCLHLHSIRVKMDAVGSSKI